MELYDRKNDPREINSVFNDVAYAQIKEQLTQQLAEIRTKYKDSKELDQKYYDMYKKK